MAGEQGKHVCCVESLNDAFVVINLLKKNGVPWPDKDRPVHLKNCTNDRGVLSSIRDEVDAAKGSGRAVGFIIDIDTTADGRWTVVRELLKQAGAKPPESPVATGFIEDIPDLQMRVGVWLMPDNKLASGRLENLLLTLIPEGEKLFGHAVQASKDAKALGAKFSGQDVSKAELHCWLAWQETPGQPYGEAVNREFFAANSAVALQLVNWFRSLYGL